MRISERAQRIEPSATLAMDTLTNQMVRQGIDVVNFTVGQPDFDTPDSVKEAGIEAIRSGFTKYTPAGGITELKEAVGRKFQRDNGLDYATNQIVISVGAKHALYNIFQVLLDPGDEVIVPAPYWVSYLEQVRLAQGSPVVVTGDEAQGFKVTGKQIEAAITPKTRALILNSPSNPTGAVYTRSELEAIADVALRHQVVVVSDEIYEPFLYSGAKHVSIAELGAAIKDLTLVVHGVSKSHAMTGWRIGYVAGDRTVVEAIAGLQSHSTSNATSIAQRAAVAALDGPADFTNRMVEQFHQRRDFAVDRLNTMPGVTCTVPQGAFYVFPNVKGVLGKAYRGQPIHSSLALAELLLTEAQVALVPGSAFGAEGYLRLSYATSLARIEAGMDRMAAFLEELD